MLLILSICNICTKYIHAIQVTKVDHHRAPVTAVQVCNASDVLVSGSRDATICLWSLDDFSLLNLIQMNKPVLNLQISSDSVSNLYSTCIPRVSFNLNSWNGNGFFFVALVALRFGWLNLFHLSDKKKTPARYHMAEIECLSCCLPCGRRNANAHSLLSCDVRCFIDEPVENVRRMLNMRFRAVCLLRFTFGCAMISKRIRSERKYSVVRQVCNSGNSVNWP